MIDYNVRAERMGWLPSAPQLKTNPMQVVKDASAAGMDAKDYVVKALKDGTLQMSCEDPDAPQNWPRNCSSGAATCWARRARATSTSASTCWAPRTASRARTWAPTMPSRAK
jgi:nitrate reductase alpha subunit